MDHFGYWAILPPLIAIGSALITRQVYLSLILGVASAAVIFVEGALLQVPIVFVDWLTEAIIDPSSGHAVVIVFTLLLGALIALLQRSGGTQGFARWAMGFAHTPRRALLVGWLLGVLVFIDDYFDTITVGTVMRPVTDQNRVSREKLAYLVDTTAAPVAVMAPVSTWVGVIVGTIGSTALLPLLIHDPFPTFLLSIPLNFYSILAMAWALILILTGVEFGPMRAAEERARTTGQLVRPGGTPLQSAELDAFGKAKEVKPRLANLILPLVVLVFTAVVSMWGTGFVSERAAGNTSISFLDAFGSADPFTSLVYAAGAAVLYAGIFFGFQRILSVKEFFEALEVGFKAMLPAVMVLVLAWTIGIAIQALGLGATMANLVAANVPLWVIPPLVFLLAGVTAFATGTSFGTFGIMLPLAIPVAAAIDPQLIPLLVAATVGGAVFGDHASPISDTTVLSSTASACDHVDHVRTQLPYAGVAAVIALVAYAGFGLIFGLSGSPWLTAGLAWLIAAGLLVAVTLVAVARFRAVHLLEPVAGGALEDTE